MTTPQLTEETNRIRIHDLWQAKLGTDPWNGWRALLGNWEIEGTKVPVDPNVPFQGYYRSRRQDKTFEPVAFFKQDDKWVCLRPLRDARFQAVTETDDDWQRVLEAWPYISRYPISHAWYKAVAEEGKPWPDADARVTSEALAKSAEAKPAAEAVKGHNNPPEETPIEAVKNKIANAKEGLADYKKITSDAQRDKAKSLKNRLTELSGEAKKERDRLSRPHLDALDEIRAVWSPLVDDAAAAAKTVNNAMDAYETEKLQERRKEEARVAAEQAEADRIRAENERAAANAETLGDIPGTQKPVPEVKPVAAPAMTETVRPGYGRAGRVKTEFVVTEITDAPLLFAFLTNPKIHAELRDKMIELAQRAKNAGLEPPGVKIEEKAKVR